MRGMRDYGPFRITLKNTAGGYQFSVALRIFGQTQQPAPFLVGTSAFADDERQAFQDAERALSIYLQGEPLFATVAVPIARPQEVAH